jgi:hypothetical protein
VGTPFLLHGPDFAGGPGDILRGQGNSWKRKSDTLQILDIVTILTHLSADHKMILQAFSHPLSAFSVCSLADR